MIQALLSLSIIGFALACIAGWLMNIINLFSANFSEFSFLLAVQLLGVVLAPLGALMGWVV